MSTTKKNTNGIVKGLAKGSLKAAKGTAKVVLGNSPSKVIGSAGVIGGIAYGVGTGDYVSGGLAVGAGVYTRYRKQINGFIDKVDNYAMGLNKEDKVKEDKGDSLSVGDKIKRAAGNLKDHMFKKEDKVEEAPVNTKMVATYFDDPSVIERIAELKEKALTGPLLPDEEALLKLAVGVGL